MTLSDSMIVTGVSDRVEIILSVQDLEAIKLEPLCTSESDCFINLPSDVVTDVYDIGNDIRPVNFAAQVTNLTRDTTPPMFEAFVYFDVNEGDLTLRFDEPIDISTLNVSALMFHSVNELGDGFNPFFRFQLVPTGEQVD